MIIVYTPEGGEPEHYDANSLKVSEASIVQRTVDMKWQDILQGLEQDDLEAMRGIVWVIKKRSNPTLRFGDFDPGVDEMTSRMSNKEVASYVDNAFEATARDPEITPEDVERILLGRIDTVAVDPEYARALIVEKAKGPKEALNEAASEAPETAQGEHSSPSPTSSEPETDTSDSSPTSSTSHPQPSMT